MPDEDKNKTGGEGANGGEGGKETTTTPATTFTQADIDRIVTERLERDRRAREEQERKEAEKAALSDVERAKSERHEALAKAEEQQGLASQADKKLDMVIEALKQGVDPQAVDRDFLQLVGAFSSTEEAPDVSVKKLLDKFPALAGGKKKNTTSGGEGADNDGGTSLPSFADYQKMDIDTKSKFFREHPETAKKYHERISTQAQAGAIWDM